MSCFRQSKRQTELFFESVLNVPASTGWLVKLQTRATHTLRPAYDELHAAVREESRLGIDETPFKECSQRVWMWVFVALQFTVFTIRGSRKRVELDATIGQQYEGIVTSDRAKMYHHLEYIQYCWAHLKRDFQSLADARHASAREIGAALVRQTRKLFRQHARYRDGTITYAELKLSLSGVREEVEALLLRGLKCDHRKTSGMCQELCFNRARLWTFLEHECVEPTNNHSERALRSAVIWRKLSFGTQSETASRFVETLLTILETCRRQNKNAIEYITHALTTGNPASLNIGV
jgi:transposase